MFQVSMVINLQIINKKKKINVKKIGSVYIFDEVYFSNYLENYKEFYFYLTLSKVSTKSKNYHQRDLKRFIAPSPQKMMYNVNHKK